ALNGRRGQSGGGCHRAGEGRRLLLGLAHGGRAARLGPGRAHLLVLRGALRRRPHRRRREGVTRSRERGRAVTMTTVPKLRASLSELLRRVKAGGAVLAIGRGRAIAR